MPHRDPETGQFVAGSGGGGRGLTWQETTALISTSSTQIPAADLSGGTTDHGALTDADAIQIIDFTEHLDSDEVFEVLTLGYMVQLTGHTTASAESTMYANWEYSRNSALADQNPSFWAGAGAQRESGVYDVAGHRTGAEQAETLVRGGLVAEPSFGDSTNGLGAGAAQGEVHDLVPFRALYGVGPMFDIDDEIYFPVVMYTDNVSDHAVELFQTAEFRGIVHTIG